MEPLRGFKITDQEIHGLLNPWKNLVDNRDLGKGFHHCCLAAQLKGALQAVCWVKGLRASFYLRISTNGFGMW